MSTHTTPGYVNFASTHHDWSDGFRLVRKEKYGSSDGLSSDYKALLAVGGLHGNEHLWPEILKDYMQVCVMGGGGRGREGGRGAALGAGGGGQGLWPQL